MTKSEAAKLVAILAALPNAKVNEQSAMLYYLALEDIAYKDAERAVAILIRTSKFMPTPSEIREVLADAQIDVPQWEDAWNEFMRTVRRYGIYFTDDRFTKHGWNGWSSEAVADAVRHVGFRNACMSDESDDSTIKAQFRNFYEGQRKRRQRALQVGAAAISAERLERIEAIEGETP